MMELQLLLPWAEVLSWSARFEALIQGRHFKLFSFGDVVAMRNINSAI